RGGPGCSAEAGSGAKGASGPLLVAHLPHGSPPGLRQKAFTCQGHGPRALRMALFVRVCDLINAPAAAARALVLRPIHHNQRPVAQDDQVCRLEGVTVVLCAGGKLEFFQGSKAAALPLRSVLYDCPAPFTEKQIALVFGRELPLELTEPASRRAEAEVR